MSGTIADNTGLDSGAIVAVGGTGKLLAMETVTNNTRTSLSAVTTWVSVISAVYTKTSATSNLIVKCTVPMYDDSADAQDVGLTDGTTVILGSWQANSNASYHKMSYTIANFGTLGAASHTISWGYRSAGGNAKPAVYVNPNATDESRLTQHHTTFVFSEVEA
tara:strand:- start:450 stop:938 length:489 start_codon:yes stop_codon:yes gene_type:complete